MPTPPEPAQMHTSLRGEPVADHSRRSSSPDSRSSSSRPSSGSNRCGSVVTGAVAARRSLRTCACSARARGVLRQSRGQRRACRRAASPAAARIALDVGRPEALRVHRVHDDRVDRHAELVGRAPARARPSRSPASPPAARPRARRSGARRAGTRRPCVGVAPDRPDACDGRVRARRAQHRQPVPGGRARPRSPGRRHGALGAALELREVPDLSHRHELGEARRRRGEVLEHAAARRAGRRASATQLVAEPLAASPRSGSTDTVGASSVRPCRRQRERCCSATSHSDRRACRGARRPGRAPPRRSSSRPRPCRSRHEPLVE